MQLQPAVMAWRVSLTKQQQQQQQQQRRESLVSPGGTRWKKPFQALRRETSISVPCKLAVKPSVVMVAAQCCTLPVISLTFPLSVQY
jgi:hypothetical protein